MQKRVLIVENFHMSQLGQVGVALAEAGMALHHCRAFAGEDLPADDTGFDGLVVLGGEQSAIDDHIHPYLPDLARLMARFGDAEKAVLGICLGSQILARAHGGENLIGAAPEFGWQTIALTDAATSDPVLGVIGGEFPIFQWHSDTFTLPPTAVHLAHNGAAANQCFRVGRASYGMQFHFEANRDVVGAWNIAFKDTIDRLLPGWLEDYEDHAETDGAVADATGLAIARAWVALI